MRENIYSVGQINHYIKNLFAQDFMLRKISVKGEVSNCKYHSSGHIYFTLKDEEGAINTVMFASSRVGLGFHMKNGDKVCVTGSIEVYEKTGVYQIYARKIDRDGEGDLYLRFEALKKELEEMGMFAAEYKQAIPKYAQRIGVVTAPTGAAVRDIQNIARRRNPYVQMILFPAKVQGDKAAESIVNGIKAMEQCNVEVIIVGRGGGSIEDLWAFNEEMVARAIFDCPIPIISAVGHETDWTIADLVADLRAPTPSAAAELAVFDVKQTIMELSGRRDQLKRKFQAKLELAYSRMELYQARLIHASPGMQLNYKRQQIQDCDVRIRMRMEQILEQKKNLFLRLADRMESQSPLKKLGRGYAYIETTDKKPLQTISQIQQNEELEIFVKDGKIRAVVSEVIGNE